MAQEVAQRDPQGKKPLVLVMDGPESLWNAGLAHLPEERFKITEVLDLLHASSYLWQAASLFYPPDSPQSLPWVKQQMGLLLEGKVNTVIESLRRQGTVLSTQRQQALEGICGYFESHAHRMAYDEYLAAGYPIASGVIEGACRCVVNDRMERSGMRWVLEGDLQRPSRLRLLSAFDRQFPAPITARPCSGGLEQICPGPDRLNSWRCLRYSGRLEMGSAWQRTHPPA
jgi:hypothetical protein